MKIDVYLTRIIFSLIFNKTDIPFMDRAMSYYLQHGFARIAEKDADVIDIHFPYVEDNLITEWDGPEKAEG